MEACLLFGDLNPPLLNEESNMPYPANADLSLRIR